ncbi:MAG: oligosaccharide flippase family protein [Sphingomonadales bacterium]|nr:oligosaccharide flippase family protein [Sphingomonadales bacterium]
MQFSLNEFLKGDGTRARALRSSAILVFGFGSSNVLRLASNLVLARLLFPEAFGLMSLVYVFLTGLAMFSDLGLNLSIIQNKRGEEPEFLNTAWTLQIIRGVILWLCACALAYPAALIYGEPQLALLLPVVGLTAIIQGFTTTKIALANRNLQIGVQVSTDLASQVVTLIVTAVMAWFTGSVWSLVVGSLVGAVLKVVAQHLTLKGPPNRWHWDRELAWDMIHFGKYIFLSSIAGFLINQSDRAILGGYISLTDLGIFMVGFMFATVPVELARAAGSQIVFPLFSKFPPAQSADNRAKVLKARRLILLATVALSGLLSLVSVPMVELLYDERYHKAGPILALLGFTVTAQIATSNYDGSYLGSGDSKQHFYLISAQAAVQVVTSFLLISRFGILGAIFAVGLTMLLAYPLRARVVHKYGAWDPKADLATLALGWGCALLSLWIWWAQVATVGVTR